MTGCSFSSPHLLPLFNVRRDLTVVESQSQINKG